MKPSGVKKPMPIPLRTAAAITTIEFETMRGLKRAPVRPNSASMIGAIIQRSVNMTTSCSAHSVSVTLCRRASGWSLRITAPIAGRVGLRRVDAGNLISANDANGLFTITQTQPVAVLFSVPEPQVPEVRAAHAATGQAAPRVEAWDRENRSRLAAGRLDTLDNQIDAATATLRLKARFENADDALFPNQFVNVRLSLRQLPGAVTVPTDAVQHGSRGSYVYVIAEGKARVRELQLGPASGGRTVVLKGLAAGEPVVLEGLDRLEDGRAVNVVKATELPAGSPLAPDAATPR